MIIRYYLILQWNYDILPKGGKRFKIYPRWKLFKEIIKKCQKREKIFEVNFHYHNNYRQLLNECLNSKTLFSLGSNAHNKNELGKITKI